MTRGSSPRGRGKRQTSRTDRPPTRLIPAWAGKTARRPAFRPRYGAHPRVGGENIIARAGRVLRSGSSPRGRGKRALHHFRERVQRLIPAWAGKTSTSTPRPASRWAHPRVGGENLGHHVLPVDVEGSSPRGRGKPLLDWSDRVVRRLIPAWAGKTIAHTGRAGLLAAHPRVGGENVTGLLQPCYALGSSPRGRGKLVAVVERGLQVRLIPAWAGKTDSGKRSWIISRAHPRVGGENEAARQPHGWETGSSPRGRGKRRLRSRRGGLPRLIPAWAGKTRPTD